MPSALTVAAFLASLAVNTHIDQGADPNHYVTVLKYTGISTFRTGPYHVDGAVSLHQQTGAKAVIFSNCAVALQLIGARQLAAAGALSALEGSNEPNNFGCPYNGAQGGGPGSWLPIAQAQRDLYAQTKADPVLKTYPVYSPTEIGAETDNVGLQWLTVPIGAGASMPDGTAFSDFANVHNYVSGHLGSTRIDNQSWGAADPVVNGPFDGLQGNHGVTWRNHFQGYSNTLLPNVPRVTTETGYNSSVAGEDVQGKILTNTYLAQFKRGWSLTTIYQAIENEGGTSETQGIYHNDVTPKLAATYIHNMTTALAGAAAVTPGTLGYAIVGQTSTIHDLLLQKDASTYDLIVWGERVSGSSGVTVDLGGSYAVKVYDITAGTTPIATYNAISSVPLTISDHAFIIEAKLTGITPPPPPPPVTLIPGPTITLANHKLVLNLSEDAYLGNAKVQIAVAGVNVFATPSEVSALASANQQQIFTVLGSWASPPKVDVSFTNDAYGGNAAADRNLYLKSGTYDGIALVSASHNFFSNGIFSFQP